MENGVKHEEEGRAAKVPVTVLCRSCGAKLFNGDPVKPAPHNGEEFNMIWFLARFGNCPNCGRKLEPPSLQDIAIKTRKEAEVVMVKR